MLKSYYKHACKFTIFMFLYALCFARNTVEHVVCMFYVRLLQRTRGVGRGGHTSLTSVFRYPTCMHCEGCSGVVCAVLITAVGWVYSRKNHCVKLEIAIFSFEIMIVITDIIYNI